MATYRMIVTIAAENRADAEALRDEIVGAIEDNAESREIDAEAEAGELEVTHCGPDLSASCATCGESHDEDSQCPMAIAEREHGPEDVDPDYYCKCGKPWIEHDDETIELCKVIEAREHANYDDGPQDTRGL